MHMQKSSSKVRYTVETNGRTDTRPIALSSTLTKSVIRAYCLHAEQGFCNGQLSVCPVYRALQQRAAGLLLGAPRAGDINRPWRAPVGERPAATAHNSTVVSSKCEQCHAYSRRRRLNTDLSSHYSSFTNAALVLRIMTDCQVVNSKVEVTFSHSSPRYYPFHQRKCVIHRVTVT